jgi:hypothetical protein
VSWQLVGILFAISALEGVRRLGPEELVLRSNPLGVWRVASPTKLWGDWHLVSILPPFFLTIVVHREVAANALPGASSDIRQFITSIEPILALRLLGALNFLAIVLGIPWGISRHGSAALFAFLGCALALSGAIALRCAAFLIGEGQSRKMVFRAAISLLSPFASPIAAESVLSVRIRRYPRLATISGLLGDESFRALVRRSAYDVERVRAIDSLLLEEIVLSISGSERARILDSAADGCTGEERYCPRCGEKYSLETSFCADCHGVALSRRGFES